MAINCTFCNFYSNLFNGQYWVCWKQYLQVGSQVSSVGQYRYENRTWKDNSKVICSLTEFIRNAVHSRRKDNFLHHLLSTRRAKHVCAVSNLQIPVCSCLVRFKSNTLVPVKEVDGFDKWLFILISPVVSNRGLTLRFLLRASRHRKQEVCWFM
jgi:hypothetical protein